MPKIKKNGEKKIKTEKEKAIQKEFLLLKRNCNLQDDNLKLNEKLLFETARTIVNLKELNQNIDDNGYILPNGKLNPAGREIVKLRACFNSQIQLLNRLKKQNLNNSEMVDFSEYE